jgi:hypothetical protein
MDTPSADVLGDATRAPIWSLPTAEEPGGLRSEGRSGPSLLLVQQKSDKSIAGEPAAFPPAGAQGRFETTSTELYTVIPENSYNRV